MNGEIKKLRMKKYESKRIKYMHEWGTQRRGKCKKEEVKEEKRRRNAKLMEEKGSGTKK